MMQPHKKLYRGPQADAATFATQQEFLDSLVPIPMESVDDNSRKCSYCWKLYGESTPGNDDAEEPVRFKCDHVFGEKCMRALFAMREPARVDLKPLSFSPGSRGADLGSRLSAYIDSQGVEKSALLTGGDRKKYFVHLLQKVMPTMKSYPGDPRHGHAVELLGKDWLRLVFEMFNHSDPHPGHFHLLENAIIMDSEHPIQHLPFTTSSMSAYGTYPTPTSAIQQPDYGGWIGSTWPPGMPSPAAYAMNPLAVPYTSWAQEQQKIKEQLEKSSPTSTAWPDILASKSGLDSLVEKHKELLQEHKQLDEQLNTAGADQKAAPSIWVPSAPTYSAPPTHSGPTQFQKSSTPAEKLAQQDANEQKRIKAFIKQLARSFARVYEAYERHQHDEAVVGSLPPPVKLSLADTNKTPSMSHAPAQELIEQYLSHSPVFLLTAIVHEKSLGAKGIEVIQPCSYEHIGTQDMDEDESDEDGLVDSDRAPAVFAGKTVLLKRKTCKKCCAKSTSLSSPLPTPEYVFWQDNKKVPDDCPICRRILFKKKG
ncbi:uncharacterized protein N0V89_001986 [Didymosphaeria variabile]|uniref:RING-type domain-containing protein n=1 Tax=Didymosphaeria variabile TaxID=1932322 RepID=A0A9W9CD48_9PLEO|nr:uncharacterized protein N0V89_001986 [Didymosphaeria variabile]KAJ4357411.1 hypothetical protein N0V89_001986 [Didymosphaeria variabile]